MFSGLRKEKMLLVLVIQDKSIFSANNRKKRKITFMTKKKRERNYNITTYYIYLKIACP